MRNGAVFEKEVLPEVSRGSTATLPSESHKPPFPEGTAPGRLVGSGRQEHSGPSLLCNWEQKQAGWAGGARQTSTLMDSVHTVGSKGTHCTMKPFKILPEPQGSSQKEDL